MPNLLNQTKLKQALAIAWYKGMSALRRWRLLALLVLIAGTASVSIWWWPGFAPPPISGTNPHALYFLAAAAQSLAAVLALVFTITLVVAQLSSRYSHRMLGNFFDPLTIGYFLVFVIVTLFPLWLLGQEQPPLWAIRASLTATAAVLLLLVPYFLRFRQMLNPASVISKLKDRALKRLRGDRQKEPEEVATINNFCMSAFVLKDYDTFDVGVQTLGTIALEASKDYRDSVGKGVFYRLMYIGRATVEDPIAPVRTIVALRDTGRKASEHANQVAAEWSAFPMANIGALAVKKGLEAQAEQTVTSLTEVGREVVEHEVSAAVRVVAGLCQIANPAIHHDIEAFEGIAVGAVNTAGMLTSKAIEKGMNDEDTRRMVWELGLVHETASSPVVDRVLHAIVHRLFIIGAWATKTRAWKTKEETKAALTKRPVAEPKFFQRDYEDAMDSLRKPELREALAEFRKDCYGETDSS